MTLIVASHNPSGRPKGSIRNPKGMLLRFINRNLSPQKLQKLYNHLTEREKLNFLESVLPYVIPRASNETLTPEQIDELHAKLMNVKKEIHGKVG